MSLNPYLCAQLNDEHKTMKKLTKYLSKCSARAAFSLKPALPLVHGLAAWFPRFLYCERRSLLSQ